MKQTPSDVDVITITRNIINNNKFPILVGGSHYTVDTSYKIFVAIIDSG